MARRRNKKNVSKVVLDLDAAEEVVDLIEDRPGTADEDVLDGALESIGDAGERIDPEDQDRAASGEAVAIEMTPDAVDAVTSLIVDDKETKTKTLRKVAARLRGKIQSARHKSRSKPDTQ